MKDRIREILLNDAIDEERDRIVAYIREGAKVMPAHRRVLNTVAELIADGKHRRTEVSRG